jgi:tetratricopeptide (TPR) repeat protein
LLVDDDVTGAELDPEVLRVLRSLRGLAEPVGKHLVMAARLVDEEPELALQHAQAASRLAGRIALVREAVGVTAYAAEEYGTALAEFRAARRLSGDDAYLPVIADCQRGLGRPLKALEVAEEAPVTLDDDVLVELALVVAGALRDLDRPTEARARLEALKPERLDRPESLRVRLWYAYADLLADLGEIQGAVTWFTRAANDDLDGVLDADERVAALLSPG